jgi:DNA-binding CsgD family transcriptional regulator
VAVNLSKTNTVESKRELLLINNSIESSMEGDELLKRFEEQFDLVNNNFMKRLSQKHPDLSANERLMCAYLKMNLSTKEMAPLPNISVRGVETMRYRIRKKFDLGRETNLIDYINSFA